MKFSGPLSLFITAIGLVAIVPDARAARLSVEAPPSCVEAEPLAEEVGTLIVRW